MSDEVDDIAMDDMSDNYVKEKSKYLLSNGFDERTLRMFKQELRGTRMTASSRRWNFIDKREKKFGKCDVEYIHKNTKKLNKLA